MVRCLENEGVTHVFGVPGEENIHFVEALSRSSIRYVLVRHEQGASFMAETYGRLTGRAGVCSATLGPGAINLLLGTADATTNSTPLIALSAQVGMDRSFKESHQGVDLVSMFAPVTKWSALVATPGAAPEMIRKAFKLAQTERPGAVYLAVPEDVEKSTVPEGAAPLAVNIPRPDEPSAEQVHRAASILGAATNPIVLAGHGATRANAGASLARFAEALGVPVATTFHGKGVLSDNHPQALGAVGFMRHDYVNFGFDHADVIVTVGYELQEFDPARINPHGDKQIIHIHRFPAEVDRHYNVAVGLQADIGRSLDVLARAVDRTFQWQGDEQRIRGLLADELDRGRADDRFPLAPARIVADTRAALGAGGHRAGRHRRPQDVDGPPLSDLRPQHLSHLQRALHHGVVPCPAPSGRRSPDRRPRCWWPPGDGAFLMNSQEIETALREHIAMVILIWVDDAYGLISWKMDLELGHDMDTTFGNPDFVAYAESFGAKGYRIEAADQLLPTLRTALADDTVSVIACPVDYSVNGELIRSLGELDDSF